MKEFVFATNNEHKLFEVQELLGNDFAIQGSTSAGITEDIPENQPSLEGNALEKARYVFTKTGKNCFADDTGLEIYYLNNEPGVFSARYAGQAKDSELNMEKVLQKLENIKNRKARFRTVIALILNGQEFVFEGIVEGEILQKKIGNKGFGYDPIFKPEGYSVSFAEMDISEKNSISHRGKAVSKLVDFLKSRFL